MISMSLANSSLLWINQYGLFRFGTEELLKILHRLYQLLKKNGRKCHRFGITVKEDFDEW
jgi:hypothetical protein